MILRTYLIKRNENNIIHIYIIKIYENAVSNLYTIKTTNKPDQIQNIKYIKNANLIDL